MAAGGATDAPGASERVTRGELEEVIVFGKGKRLLSEPWDDEVPTAFNASFAEWGGGQQREWVEGGADEVCGDWWEEEEVRWRRGREELKKQYFANRTDLRRKSCSETAEHTP